MKSENAETQKRRNAETLRAEANVVACGAVAEEGTHDFVLVPDGYTKNLNGVEWNVDDEAWRMINSAFRAGGTALPIDVTHESEKDGILPKDKLGAVGWVEDLRYEKGRGIIGTVTWNEEGKLRIRSGRFRYLSPVMFYQKDGAKRATELISVGLVNRPAIPRMERMAAEATHKDKLAAGQRKDVSMMGELTTIAEKLGLAADATVENILSKIGEMMKKGEEAGAASATVNSARTALGLKPDAGESEIVVAINSHKQNATASDAAKNELAALKDRIVTMEAQKLIDAAMAANKINPKETEDVAICTQLAKEKPERFTALMSERRAKVEPGRTTPPEGGATGGDKSREGIIVNSAKKFRENDSLGAFTTCNAYVSMKLQEAGQARLSEDEAKKIAA